MSKINNGDMPAGPQSVSINDNGDAEYSERAGGAGLTKREHFAAMAMQGLMSSGNMTNAAKIIETSVRAADALLEELEK